MGNRRSRRAQYGAVDLRGRQYDDSCARVVTTVPADERTCSLGGGVVSGGGFHFHGTLQPWSYSVESNCHVARACAFPFELDRSLIFCTHWFHPTCHSEKCKHTSRPSERGTPPVLEGSSRPQKNTVKDFHPPWIPPFLMSEVGLLSGASFRLFSHL